MKNIEPFDFDDFITAPLSLILWSAPWCSPCKMITPHLEALALTYSGRMTFGKVNTDKDPLRMKLYGIRGVPTLILFSNGQPLGAALVGAHTKAQMEAFITSNLTATTVGQVTPAPESETTRVVDPRLDAAVPRRIPGWSRRR